MIGGCGVIANALYDRDRNIGEWRWRIGLDTVHLRPVILIGLQGLLARLTVG